MRKQANSFRYDFLSWIERVQSLNISVSATRLRIILPNFHLSVTFSVSLIFKCVYSFSPNINAPFQTSTHLIQHGSKGTEYAPFVSPVQERHISKLAVFYDSRIRLQLYKESFPRISFYFTTKVLPFLRNISRTLIAIRNYQGNPGQDATVFSIIFFSLKNYQRFFNYEKFTFSPNSWGTF